MSIFGKIKDAIWGKAQAAPASPAPAAAASATNAPASTAPVASTGAEKPVDIEAILTNAASKVDYDTNWRTSIVDLMKLCGLDSSLENRKELAKELGYSGDMNDSATMNIWLHKQVMNKLAENGGFVPADLKD